MTTLYDVLGVAPTASEQEIKQAWRVMVRRYHPDTSDAVDSMAAFERVQHAYRILSDVEKRLDYDRRTLGYSHAGLTALREQIRRSRKPAPRQGDDMTIVVQVPFEQMLTGGAVVVRGRRLVTCSTCGGWCTANGQAPEVCMSCDGKGQTSVRRDDGKAVIRSCQGCGGRGYLLEAPCSDCASSGRVSEAFVRDVTLPAWVRDGMNIRMGPGHEGIFGGGAGHLYVTPRVLPHPYYAREDDVLTITMMVNPVEALLGGSVGLPPLAGRTMPRVDFPAFVGAFDTHATGAWDVRVRFVVEMPDALPSEVVQTLREVARLLPEAAPKDKFQD